MSSEESDGEEAFEGLDWDTWKDAALRRETAHPAPPCLITADAAAMPSQKAVCYGYYPSFELNSMLLVKCKVCSMLVKDVGYGHHVRSRHAFRAESPNSGDECQAFLLSPPHCIASPRHSDSAIISPPYRKPSTSFQIGNASNEEHIRDTRAITTRPISARYSIEQRDDLKLALRVSRREVTNDAPLLATRSTFAAADGPPKLSSMVDGEERKPVTASQTSKAVNGRAKQKKRKKRKADSSSSDDFSLDHFRRKKRLDSERLNDMSAVPSTSTALHVDLSQIDKVPLGGEQRLHGISSSPLLCIPSRSSVSSRSVTTRSSPKVDADSKVPDESGEYVASSAQYVPLLLPHQPSPYRDQSESVSPFGYSSPEAAPETAVGLRLRRSAEAKLKGSGFRKAAATGIGSPSPKQVQPVAACSSVSRGSSRASAQLSPISERNAFYLNSPSGVSNNDDSYHLETEEQQMKRRSPVLASPTYNSPVFAASYPSLLTTADGENYVGSATPSNQAVGRGASPLENCDIRKEDESENVAVAFGLSEQNEVDEAPHDSQLSAVEDVPYASPAGISCRDAYTSPITVNCVEASCQSGSFIAAEEVDDNALDETAEVHTFRSPVENSNASSVSRFASPVEVVAVVDAYSGGVDSQPLQQQQTTAEEFENAQAISSEVKDVASQGLESGPLVVETRTTQRETPAPAQVDADTCALIAAFSASSRSEEEANPYKELKENDQDGFVVMKQERGDSPSSSASVVALSPEVPSSEMETAAGGLREDESEEETDSALHRALHRCSHVHFITPSIRPRRPHVSTACGSSFIRVHRTCPSPTCDSSDCCVRPEYFSQRRHVDLQIANARMIVAQGMGVSLNYPSFVNPSPPSFVSVRQTRQCGVPNKVETCSPSPRAPSESTVSSNLDPISEMSHLPHTTSSGDFSLQAQSSVLASDQAQYNEETVRATQSIEPDVAEPMTVQNGVDTTIRLSAAPSHRMPSSPFVSPVPSRVASAVNGVTARAHDQNGRVLHTLRTRSGALQKAASPLILSANGASLHSIPSHSSPSQQLRYVYIQTGSSVQPSDFDGVYETAEDELITEAFESDVYEGLSVIREPKGAGGRFLRQISAQRVYDPPPVLKKMRLSVHETGIRNDAILTAVSSPLASGIARRLSRQAIDSVSTIDAPFYVPTSTSGVAINTGGRMTIGTHSYAVSSGVARVASPFAFGKGAHRSSVTTCNALPRNTFAGAHSFRRVASTFSSNGNSKSTLAGGGVLSTQIASGGPGTTGVEQRGLSMVSHGSGVRGTTLAGVRTGPRTVTVVPVLSKYAPPAPPRLLSGMTAALFRSSAQGSIPPSPSNTVSCISPITTETRTC